MNKCKDCEHFKKDCGFSSVDEQLGLNGDFVACGQFVKSKTPKDCLSCSHSFSEPCEEGGYSSLYGAKWRSCRR